MFSLMAVSLGICLGHGGGEAEAAHISRSLPPSTFQEGWPMLLQGLGPTLVGYLWYGITVYPGYELFKRLFTGLVGPLNAALFRVPLVLAAGAAATCFACIGVCPAEVRARQGYAYRTAVRGERCGLDCLGLRRARWVLTVETSGGGVLPRLLPYAQPSRSCRSF